MDTPYSQDYLKQQEIDKKLGITPSEQPTQINGKDIKRSEFLNSFRNLGESYLANSATPEQGKNLVNKYAEMGSKPTNLNDTDLINKYKATANLLQLPKMYGETTPKQSTPIETPQPTGQEQEDQQLQAQVDAQDADQDRADQQAQADETQQQKMANLQLDDDESEHNTYGDEEDVQNEDPNVAQEAITDLASRDTFQTPEQTQAALNLYGTSPSVQQFFRTSPQDMVLQTAIGRELEKIAQQHNIVPEQPTPNQRTQQFQQGNGIYVDPVSGKPVSRPGFFKRLGNAIKYMLGIGDMYETLPMQQGQAGQNPQQQTQPNLTNQAMQTSEAFNALNLGQGQQGNFNLGQRENQAPAYMSYDQYTPNYMMQNPSQYLQAINPQLAMQQPRQGQGSSPMLQASSQGVGREFDIPTGMSYNLPRVYNPYSPLESVL